MKIYKSCQEMGFLFENILTKKLGLQYFENCPKLHKNCRTESLLENFVQILGLIQEFARSFPIVILLFSGVSSA